MQVDPIKPVLKAPGTTRLKLKYGKLLSSFAFKFNLRRYIEGEKGLVIRVAGSKDMPVVRRCRLNLSKPL